MIAAMARAGYPSAFSASVIGAAAATDILIPPSIALIVYSVLVPGASVPALFAAGMVPGILAGLALILPTIWLSRRHGLGQGEASQDRPPFWARMREAFWGLMAPFLILGGMRMGWFTPTEAAAVAVAYGLFVGMFVHRTIKTADLFPIFKEAAEISAVILLIIGLASIFAYSVNTLSIIDPITQAILQTGLGSTGALLLLVALLLVVGMFLDGVSIFLIFVPLVMPLMRAYQWDPVWFGILLTMMVAVGQFTPPMAVNLMVSCKMAGVSMEQTFPWVWWLVLAMMISMLAVLFFPPLALWLPQYLGY
jgi:tripartite ATP-independent transporter DctM subunit